MLKIYQIIEFLKGAVVELSEMGKSIAIGTESNYKAIQI